MDDVAEQGRAFNLDPAVTGAFFDAQIEAAKMLQRADFHRWESDQNGPDGDPPDLAGVLRPRIDGLNRKLLEKLAAYYQGHPRDGQIDIAEILKKAETLLVGDGIDAKVRAVALRPIAP